MSILQLRRAPVVTSRPPLRLFPGYAFDLAYAMSATNCLATLPCIPGEIVLRIPDGLSYKMVREVLGPNTLHQTDTWDEYDWNTQSLPAGIYHLRLPIPSSNNLTLREQKKLLLPGEKVAPVALVSAAMLFLHFAGIPDPLFGGQVRCAEASTRGVYRVVMTWVEEPPVRHLVAFDTWNSSRMDWTWLAAYRPAA